MSALAAQLAEARLDPRTVWCFCRKHPLGTKVASSQGEVIQWLEGGFIYDHPIYFGGARVWHTLFWCDSPPAARRGARVP